MQFSAVTVAIVESDRAITNRSVSNACVSIRPVDVRGDFIIVGSGIAGLRAAVELAPAGDIIIITKADPTESNTEYAQGGIAAAIGPDDSPELHARDTMVAGDGLCDERAVGVLCDEGPRYTRELIEWGARFDRDIHGLPALASEGAHSVRRVLHATDATGREIGRVLWERAVIERAYPGPEEHARRQRHHRRRAVPRRPFHR